ncbi:hypothetical protein [Adlercreutzia muris]|uniref:hypothetical protein n=1 Tax=Adlercreutzia muris TaxID=1796610 RepID=UPI003516B952
MQERWELVAYVNSTVIDDVAQPLARESSVSGALNDTYGLGRLSTVGGTEAVPVADTYLEDGFGSVSAVMAGDGRIAASYAYAEGNPVASADPTGHVSAAKNRYKQQQAAKKRATKQSTARKSTIQKLKKTSAISKIVTTVKRVQSARKAKTIWAPLKKATQSIAKTVRQSGYKSGGSGGGGSGWSPGSSSYRGGKSTSRSAYRAAAASRYAKTFEAVTRTLCGTASYMGSSQAKAPFEVWRWRTRARRPEAARAMPLPWRRTPSTTILALPRCRHCFSWPASRPYAKPSLADICYR